MLNITTNKDKTIDVYYTGSGNYSRAKINISSLSYSFVIDSYSNPKIQDFLNPNINSKLNIPITKDGVFNLEFLLMNNLGDCTWEKGKNLIKRDGLYNQVDKFISIGNTIYEVDKTKSTTDTLFLKSPIGTDDCTLDTYSVIKYEDYFVFTSYLEDKMVDSILNYEPCDNCKPVDCRNLQLLLALKIKSGCSNYKTLKSIWDKLSSLSC